MGQKRKFPFRIVCVLHGRANEENSEANPGRRDYGTNLFLVVHPPAFRSIPRSLG